MCPNSFLFSNAPVVNRLKAAQRSSYIYKDYKANTRFNGKKVIDGYGESSFIGVVGQNPVCSRLG